MACNSCLIISSPLPNHQTPPCTGHINRTHQIRMENLENHHSAALHKSKHSYASSATRTMESGLCQTQLAMGMACVSTNVHSVPLQSDSLGLSWTTCPMLMICYLQYSTLAMQTSPTYACNPSFLPDIRRSDDYHTPTLCPCLSIARSCIYGTKNITQLIKHASWGMGEWVMAPGYPPYPSLHPSSLPNNSSANLLMQQCCTWSCQV